MSHYLFEAPGTMPLNQFWTMQSPVCLINFGAKGANQMGTALEILKVTESDGLHVIRRISALSELPNNSIRLFQHAGAKIGIAVEGAPNLYVEWRDIQPEYGGGIS